MERAGDDFRSGLVGYGSFCKTTIDIYGKPEEKICWIASKADVRVPTSRNKGKEKMEIGVE